MSQNVNRSQHASTDYHDSNLAVSLRSHSNSFSATVDWKGHNNHALSSPGYSYPHRGLKPAVPHTVAVSRTPHPTSFSLVLLRLTSEIAPRPSLSTDFPLHASTIHPTATASSVKARPPGLKPKLRLTNNSAAATSSVNARAPRPRNNLLIKSSFPPQRNAKLVSQRFRLTDRSEFVTMAFSLTPSHFGEDPWHSRVVVSRQHLRQQQHPSSCSSLRAPEPRTPAT